MITFLMLPSSPSAAARMNRTAWSRAPSFAAIQAEIASICSSVRLAQ